MTLRISNISDEAVRKATGKTWNEWCAVLDREGAGELTHKEIAKMLRDKGYVDSFWWCQTVTVGYEVAKGRRVVGQTADAGFQLGAQRTFSISAKKAWQLITKPPGRDAWLGKTAKVSFAKGEQYETKEGTRGEIRSIKDGEFIRLTYQPKDYKKPSTLQVRVIAKGDRSAISFHQEKLASERQRNIMRKHWKAVLDKLEMHISHLIAPAR